MNRTAQRIQHIVMGITFCLIVITGIYFKQPFFRMLPLFISLVVLMQQGNANRWGYLLGGLNCLLYGAVYLHLGLYASALSSALFSFPIQVITFFNWKRHAYKGATIFKKMTVRGRVLAIVLFAAVWGGIFAALSVAGSPYAILDNTASLLGITVSLLSMLAYIEYCYLWPAQIIMTVFLNLQVMLADVRQTTYFVYSLYSLYCVVQAFFRVRALYRDQQRVA